MKKLVFFLMIALVAIGADSCGTRVKKSKKCKQNVKKVKKLRKTNDGLKNF